jgi:mRNA interferase RelE/StbE
MKFSVFLHPKADEALRKLDKTVSERLVEKIRALESFPERRGECLKPSDYYKLRVGDYRAVYEIWHADRKVVVLFVGHRSMVYDDFSRLV